ncbi:MAG: hypothetical protein HGB04_04050 [Chlorobiaceae bacterium]|nr:hypothetical protein [Chlorobiaceae bacterium]
MGFPLLDIITTVGNGILDTIKGKQEAKRAVDEKTLALKLKAMDNQHEVDIADMKATTDYDLAALNASSTSWKDEYLTILLSAPVIGSFVPGVQDYVVHGWVYLAKAPIWFQTSFIGVIAATFGLRWLFNRPASNDGTV